MAVTAAPGDRFLEAELARLRAEKQAMEARLVEAAREIAALKWENTNLKAALDMSGRYWPTKQLHEEPIG